VNREAIERRDFPVGRKGYDPAAVDAHLRAVADEVGALRERAGSGGLSAATSEQVRVILEAAERGAAELRSQAGRDAGEHVARVEAAAGRMLEQLAALQGELDGIVGSLAALRREVASAGGEAADERPVPVAVEPAVAPAIDEPADPAAIAQAANGAPDEAGARLIALNMALSGTPRDETARYLAEHYGLDDAGDLLDDVYTRAQPPRA
jgi:DivIVA domain-containing protein